MTVPDAARPDLGHTVPAIVERTAHPAPHSHPVRVYYEDTDLAGIVYYANYLKFIERGRSEWIASLGLDQRRLRDEDGLVFAVRRVEADYLRPAVFADDLVVTTRLVLLGGARLVLDQAVLRGQERLFQAAVTLVCMSAAGAAVRLPDALRSTLQSCCEASISSAP